MARPSSGSLWIGATFGFVVMVALALAQASGVSAGGGEERNFALLVVAGVAGASAMILPGVSGGYLLLVLGQYVAILGGIDELVGALKARDLSAIWAPALEVVLPVGLGVVIGVVAVSNLLKVLLARYERPTLGALLGLLLGAVVGLWPFQAGVRPEVGDVVRGRTMTPELLDKLDPDKYPTEYFTPSIAQVLGALGLIGLGFGVTALIDRFGQERKPPKK
jgi:putative membrane protein